VQKNGTCLSQWERKTTGALSKFAREKKQERGLEEVLMIKISIVRFLYIDMQELEKKILVWRKAVAANVGVLKATTCVYLAEGW
ncbi:hypothetical protein ACJX0J_007009, partial [Zea mays]